jgi:AraC-like DNA-binding protein
LNFKGSRNKYITLYVTEAWLQRNMLSNRLFEEARLNAFLKSDQPCIVWELTDDDSSMRYFNIFDKVLEVNDDIKPIDFFNLKLTTFNFLNEFLTSCKENQFFKEEQSISTLDGLQIQQVEHYLNNHLFHDFPGIEMLAAKFNLSETKLKTSFKNHFGKSVYQYFQTKKMHVAMELLQENELLVKEISYKLGYENTSKFSAVFKKHFGVLPSQIHAASKSVN